VKVVVIGGGCAGLAAAIGLAERRHQVTLLERRGILGGRATSFRDAVTGEEVDNGTHLLVAAYTATLDLLRRAGATDLFEIQDGLRLDWIGDRGYESLVCPPLVAPLHLLAGLLGLRVPWRVKAEAVRFGLAVRFGRRPDGLTLAEWFQRTGQGPQTRRLLWDPLAIAILNQVPERAAAVLFHRVYQEAFLAGHRASRLVFLRCGWATVQERLAGYLEGRGGIVRRGARAQAMVIREGRVSGVRLAQRPAQREALQAGSPATPEELAADAVVAAVPWHALPALLPEGIRERPPFGSLHQFGGAPIVSVELWLDRPVLDRAMVGLRDQEMEWVFDKGRLFGRSGGLQHLSFIVSAAFRSTARPNAELVAAAEQALRRYFPAMAGARVLRHLVLREPEATFSAGPEVESLRPGPVSGVPGLFLAGDWTNTGLPATIEGAVRSGLVAAKALDRGTSPG
jgi:squalene-associated FAD-dependent desaturase